MTISELGNKICIIGVSSSGKSTLANAISKKFNLPCCHLDTIAHIPNTNWQRKNDREFIKLHDDIIKNDSWVIEGNYKICMENRFKQATSVIWLDFNIYKCVFYYIKRCFSKSKRYGKLQGSTKEFSWEMINYILFGYKNKISFYEEIIANHNHLKVIILKNRKELNSFYEEYKLKL